MKKYKTYKDSGVDWIGDIPEDWNVSQYKFVAEVQNGFAFKSNLFDKSEGFPILRIRDITSGRISTYYQGEFTNDYVVSRNDFLIGMDGDFNVRWWDKEDVLLNQRCCRIINKDNADKRFLYYILPINLQIINDLTYYTTVKHLSSGDINNAKFSLPSLEEQTQIANYLDHKTTIIDALIEKKQQLIKKLQAQRQAIINEAVTKGLNPNAKMKDSGVEWLGEIPEHWEIVKLNYLVSKIGDGLHSTPKYTDDEEYYFINGNNLNDGIIELYETTRTVDKVEFDNLWKEIDDNTLLLSINGTIGNVALYNNEPIILGKSACFINCESRINREFLMRLFQSSFYKDYFMNELTGTTIYNLSLETIRNSKIILPDLSVQKKIAYHLNIQLAKADELLINCKSSIKKLKSYRQSIISEAVTGKIDLRDWQAPTKN